MIYCFDIYGTYSILTKWFEEVFTENYSLSQPDSQSVLLCALYTLVHHMFSSSENSSTSLQFLPPWWARERQAVQPQPGQPRPRPAPRPPRTNRYSTVRQAIPVPSKLFSCAATLYFTLFFCVCVLVKIQSEQTKRKPT